MDVGSRTRNGFALLRDFEKQCSCGAKRFLHVTKTVQISSLFRSKRKPKQKCTAKPRRELAMSLKYFNVASDAQTPVVDLPPSQGGLAVSPFSAVFS